MSFHNRLLLNRLAVNGHKALEVMLLAKAGGLDRVVDRLAVSDGRATRTERAIGYVRGTVPLAKLLDVVESSDVEAYQIASLSKAGWYRDGPPQENAEMFRRYERSPIVPPDRPDPDTTLPPMKTDAAHDANRAADVDVGIDEWLTRYPTYDGRGVTIALIETAQVEFNHPAFRSAKTLDGTDVPKFAGIFNPIELDEPDDTRVDLSTEIRALSPWHRVGTRTYIVPGAGTYRFGTFTPPAGANLVYQFGVLRDIATGEIRVDTDGDADFREETPITPSTTAVHTQQLRLSAARTVDLSFAVTDGPSSRYVNVYTAVDGHHTMTASVAAGNRGGASLADGVAPGARVLLVRNTAADLSLRATLEAYLDTMQRTDVDIVCDSMGIDIVPDTAADFTGLFMSRLIATYGKPVVHSAGNADRQLASTWPLGDALAVGGAISPESFASLYGGAALESLIVDPRVSAGPALDGALKPDFIAPVSRIAASVYLDQVALTLPANRPAVRVPGAYQISCCSSATSPYAAGVAALLMSAAKQTTTRYSAASLGRALRVSARALSGWASYQQGGGLIQVEAAWTELQTGTNAPSIVATGPNAHLLSPYAANGVKGPGLFEREGWQAGTQGIRVLTFTRMSGPAEPLIYPLKWKGNDGTFDTARSITLPLHRSVDLPVSIHPRAPGAHSAILNLHDSADTVVSQSQLVVVAAEPFDPRHRRVHLAGRLGLLQSTGHFIAVPRGVQAMQVDLTVLRGSLSVSMVRADGLLRKYYWHLDPSATRIFPAGRHSLILPMPTAGTWGVTLSNASAMQELLRSSVSASEAEYTLSMQLLSAAVEPHVTADGAVAVHIANEAGLLAEPVLDVSMGNLRTHTERTAADGLPRLFPIDVPSDAATLMLRLLEAGTANAPLDLFLYDCTTGECFSYDFTLPSGLSHTFVVRAPKAGRWVAAVNSAPSPAQAVQFVLEEIVAGRAVRHQAREKIRRLHGARWTERLRVPSQGGFALPNAARVLLFELVDAAAARDARAHPWENRDGLPNLGERAVAVGTAVLRITSP